MHKLILYLSLLMLVGNVFAQKLDDIDEDYMQIMEDRQKSLAKNIGVQNAKDATEDATVLDEMCEEITDFYSRKGNAQDAVDWSNESKALTIAIRKYVANKDFDNATIAATSLAKICKACHRVYKKDKK